MKKIFMFVFCLIVCLCILNYNNKDATFDIEQYLNNINENVSYMPLPPSISDFKTYQEFVDDNSYGFTRGFFAWVGDIMKVLWSFIIFPYKVIWFFISNIKVIIGDLLIWS
ncbi:unknown [Staphylococcus sp. CAG:324]|nr:unknown [Staphylococcus sp. CAG:324]